MNFEKKPPFWIEASCISSANGSSENGVPPLSTSLWLTAVYTEVRGKLVQATVTWLTRSDSFLWLLKLLT